MWRKVYIDPRVLDKEKIHPTIIKKAAQKINPDPRNKNPDPQKDHQKTVDIDGSHLFIVYNILREDELYIVEARYTKK